MKAQMGNDWSSILPKSSQARKKKLPEFSHLNTLGCAGMLVCIALCDITARQVVCGFSDMGLSFRLLLLQEKEQLLRELRSIDPKGRSSEEMTSIRQRIAQLEYDLKHALQISNKQIQERSVTGHFVRLCWVHSLLTGLLWAVGSSFMVTVNHSIWELDGGGGASSYSWLFFFLMTG